VSLEDAPIPDLLRRFIATPHTFCIGVGENSVRLETNDLALLADFQSEVQQLPLGYSWKLIRDDVTGRGDETTVIVSGSLIVVLLGTVTLVIVDRDRRQVLGFVASDVHAGNFLNRLSSILAESMSLPTETYDRQSVSGSSQP
jgi:hypothetical protein